jgi:hypothetical protein
METIDADRTNGHTGHHFGQHAYDEIRDAVTSAVEQGRDLVKTIETRIETRPYLAAGIGLGIASLVLGAGALIIWLPRRRPGLAHSINRLVDDVLDAALRRLRTAI